MPAPSSGEIKISQINTENAATTSNSLKTLSETAIEGLSTLNEAPYAMSEFHGYTHTLTQTITETKNLRDTSSGHQAVYTSITDTFGMGFNPIITRYDMYVSLNQSAGTLHWYVRAGFSGATSTYTLQNGTSGTLSSSSWRLVASYAFTGGSNTGIPDSVTLVRSHSESSSGSGGLGGGSFTQRNGSAPSGATGDLNPYGTAVTFGSGSPNTKIYTYEYDWQTGAECHDYQWTGKTDWSLKFSRSGYFDLTGTSFEFEHYHFHDQDGPC